VELAKNSLYGDAVHCITSRCTRRAKRTHVNGGVGHQNEVKAARHRGKRARLGGLRCSCARSDANEALRGDRGNRSAGSHSVADGPRSGAILFERLLWRGLLRVCGASALRGGQHRAAHHKSSAGHAHQHIGGYYRQSSRRESVRQRCVSLMSCEIHIALMPNKLLHATRETRAREHWR
jgi:hypothetical protein